MSSGAVIQKCFAFKGRKAQALVELAIFGSFIIMLLGVMVSYGLRSEYVQQAMMTAFRWALADANSPMDPGRPGSPRRGTGSVNLILDREIPNPSDSLAMGSLTPVSASARVVRDWQLMETADPDWPANDPGYPGLPETYYAELPRVRTLLNDDRSGPARITPFPPNRYIEFDCGNVYPGARDPGCATSGFVFYGGSSGSNGIDGFIRRGGKFINKPGTDRGTDVHEIDRMEEIFGSVNVWVKALAPSPPCQESLGQQQCRPDPNNPGSEICVWVTLLWRCRVAVIDSCSGQVFNYDDCVRQARMIVDDQACAQECEKGRGPENRSSLPSCGAVCSWRIPRPWYAQGEYRDPVNGRLRFLNLENAFRQADSGRLGIQPGGTSQSQTSANLQKVENTSEIATTDTKFREDTIGRRAVYRTMSNQGGGPTFRDVESKPKIRWGSGSPDRTWRTRW